MLPPGRRRLSAFCTLLTFLLLLTPSIAISAVLGIDLGTEYFKASLVKPGIPGEIVLSKDSKRKESAALAFKPSQTKSSDFPERLYGGDAVALTARFPGDVYANLKTLLGVSVGDNVVGVFGERYPGLKIVDASRGTVGFKSGTFTDKEDPFLVEELLAMELKNIKGNAEALAGRGSTVRDAVITFPAFYTAEEKRAVQLAAELAGLRVLSLISDGLAVGVNYATTRNFPSISEGGKPEYHVVFDMGAGSTTATVLRFQGRTVKDVGRFNKTVQEVHVLGAGWDRSLGGDALNQLIVDNMVSKFLESKKLQAMGVEPKHIKEHGRTMAKLWKESERLRQVLSANTETSASFEGLFYDDVNFRYKLSRADFETLAAEPSSRVRLPLIQALDAAKLTIDDIESIILHGGAVRTPFVQKQLELAAGGSKKLRSNVNADESAVFGASFRGAALSGGYRVKDIRSGDTPGYTVGLKWTSEGKERQQKLFTPTSQIAAEKQVPLKTLEDVELILYQQIPTASSDELVDTDILKIKTDNLTASVAQLKETYGCAPQNISTKFAVRLRPFDGLPEVTRGTVSCEVEGPEKKDGVVDGVKGFFGFGKKSGQDGQEVLDEETIASSSESSTATTDTSIDSTSSTTTSSKSKSTKDAKTKKEETGPRTIIIPISLSSSPLGTPPLSKDALKRINDRLSAFDAADTYRKQHSEALNILEAFTYRAREYLTDESFIGASTSKARDLLENKLSVASDWIYSDGVEAKVEVVKEKLKELKDIVDPVLKRRDEETKRPEAVQKLRDALEQTRSLAEAVKQSIERAAEEASSAEAAAASASSSSSSSTDETSAPASTESSETDPFDELDSDPYSSSSSPSSSASPSSTPLPFASPYTSDELASLKDAYEITQKWLEETLAAQEKLSNSDDPVLLIKDLDKKAKEQSDLLMKLLTKKIRIPPVPPKGEKVKPKSKTVKAKAAKRKDKKLKGPLDDKGLDGLQIEEIVLGDEESSSTSSATKEKASAKSKGKGKGKGNGKVKDEL